MNLPLIITELKKLLPENTSEYSDNTKWKTYCTLSGYDEDGYFDLYFMEYFKDGGCIEIAHTTDFPLKYVEMIKKIDKEAVISYTNVEKTKVTV